MIAFWQVLVLIGLVMVFGVAMCAIGAYAVFRSKREPHERFIGGVSRGEVFSIDNLSDDYIEENQPPEPPDNIQARGREFLNQFEGGMVQ